MDDKTKNLLRSELYSASSYTDRIFHALIDISNNHNVHEVRELCSKMSFDLEAYLSNTLFKNYSSVAKAFTEDLTILRNYLKSTTKLIEAFIQLPFEGESTTNTIVEYINLLYQHSQKLHSLCFRLTSIEVQLPRVNLIRMMDVKTENGEEDIPAFELPKEHLNQIASLEIGSIRSLEWQRQQKHEQFIQKGHEAIYQKNYALALQSFTKALNYKENAEVLTLIAWSYSLLEQMEKAKSYCLKAIKKDPDYGPPYNDLGSYLLAEGRIEESLKWFELAKKAVNYQNREYPYINSGRAYMAKKNMAKALEEFSKALTLAPFHEELHQTVEKLKKSLQKEGAKSLLQKVQDTDPSELPPSVF